MRQRLLYMVKFYLVTVLFFVVAKIAFMLINHEGHDFTATDVWQVVRHGLSLDLSLSADYPLPGSDGGYLGRWKMDEDYLARLLRFHRHDDDAGLCG